MSDNAQGSCSTAATAALRHAEGLSAARSALPRPRPLGRPRHRCRSSSASWSSGRSSTRSTRSSCRRTTSSTCSSTARPSASSRSASSACCWSGEIDLSVGSMSGVRLGAPGRALGEPGLARGLRSSWRAAGRRRLRRRALRPAPQPPRHAELRLDAGRPARPPRAAALHARAPPARSTCPTTPRSSASASCWSCRPGCPTRSRWSPGSSCSSSAFAPCARRAANLSPGSLGRPHRQGASC